MFALSAKFRESRCEGCEGSVYYVIREGRRERCVTGDIRGTDRSVLTSEKVHIAFDLKTIYCVIESLVSERGGAAIEDVVARCRPVFDDRNPYAQRIELLGDSFPVNRQIASISGLYADCFRFARTMEGTKGGILSYTSYLAAEYKANHKTYTRTLRSLSNSLSRYVDGVDIPLMSIGEDFVIGYAAYLRDKVSAGTLSFYLRALKSVLTRARKENLLSPDFVWPQEIKSRVSMPAATGVEKALGHDTLIRLSNINLEDNPRLELARDTFLFSFYTRGMELVDIANLRHENIDGDTLTFRRRQVGKAVTVKLGVKARAILDRYRDENREYLFPILKRTRKYTFGYARLEMANALAEVGQRIDSPERLCFSMSRYSVRNLIHSSDMLENLVI